MSQLTSLHQRLAAFRHRRQRIRWGMAWSALCAGGLATLAALFTLDVVFELSVIQRVTMLALAAGVMVWAIRRFVWPWLGVRETETDVALLVESQHGIDSDMVAALQFDRSQASSWGSRELQSAVIARIAELSPTLDVTRGIDYAPLIRRLRFLAAAALVATTVTALFPHHVGVFFLRMLQLSVRHYPTATEIETVEMNGVSLWDQDPATTRPRHARAAKNRPVTFLIQCSGELPEGGSIECESLVNGTTRKLELRRLTPEEQAARVSTAHRPADRSHAWYVAELPRLVEEFQYTLRLGDAWTDPAQVELIEPPLVDLSIQVTPPSYAARSEPPAQSPRHLAVLEGSRISLNLRCLDSLPQTELPKSKTATGKSRPQEGAGRKSLKSVTIRMDAGGTVSTHAFQNLSGDGWNWSLPDKTPLSHVKDELRYEIQVLDHDGMGLESPLQGYVQLKVDRPPTVVSTVVHRVVLPNAQPIIEFRLNDDYGIATAQLQGRIERQPGSVASPADSTEVDRGESFELPIPLDPSPQIGENLPHRGRFALDLAKFQLVKGDQLKLTVAVLDYRGENTGQQALSEPILLEVSDEAGVLTAITEADERSEKRLGDVIKQQIGVGGNK